jgi:hypothetical protein
MNEGVYIGSHAEMCRSVQRGSRMVLKRWGVYLFSYRVMYGGVHVASLIDKYARMHLNIRSYKFA